MVRIAQQHVFRVFSTTVEDLQIDVRMRIVVIRRLIRRGFRSNTKLGVVLIVNMSLMILILFA